jgi:hypothetical protein
MGRQLLILTALHHEAAAIVKALTPDQLVRVEVIGPGGARLPQVEKHDAGGIIMAGLAGGIDPQLNCGDIVIDDLSECGDLKLPCRKGKIHSAGQIVATPREKEELFRATGALVVDMESDAARRRAAEWSVPYLGIRAVLDPADETLDPALLRLTDSGGHVRPGRLVAELWRRPGFIGTLWNMRSRSAAALRALASAVRQVVEQDCFGLQRRI